MKPWCACSADQFNYIHGKHSLNEKIETESRTINRNYLDKTVTEAPYYDGRIKNTDVNETFIPLSKEDKPLIVLLPDLDISLYSLDIYGTIKKNGREKLDNVWKPLPIHFKLFDHSTGDIVATGFLLLKQGFSPRYMQSFSFHIMKKGTYRAELKVHHTAMETAEILHIVLRDRLVFIPNKKIKKRQTGEVGALFNGSVVLDEAQLEYDSKIWNNYVGMNTHVIIDHHTKCFKTVPDNSKWELLAFEYRAAKRNTWDSTAFSNFSIVDDYENNGDANVFDTSLMTSIEPVAISESYPDYGACVYDATGSESGTPTYHCRRAEIMGYMYLDYYSIFLSTLRKYPHLCFEGELDKCHKASVALIRMSMDYPSIYMTNRGAAYNTQLKDVVHGADWSSPQWRNGKFYYQGWSWSTSATLFFCIR